MCCRKLVTVLILLARQLDKCERFLFITAYVASFSSLLVITAPVCPPSILYPLAWVLLKAGSDRQAVCIWPNSRLILILLDVCWCCSHRHLQFNYALSWLSCHVFFSPKWMTWWPGLVCTAKWDDSKRCVQRRCEQTATTARAAQTTESKWKPDWGMSKREGMDWKKRENREERCCSPTYSKGQTSQGRSWH